jgi:2-isopropylmalate synthase
VVKILDSTLREGEQTPGVAFDIHIKVAIAKLLDQLGIDIIEAGHPVVTNDIRQAVEEIARRGFRAITGAHSRSLKSDVNLALQCGAGFLGVFYCVSDERLNHHEKKLNQAVDRIIEVITYAREKKKNLLIRYTPEDTVRSAWKNVRTAAIEAVRAGADIISIADTTGYMIPGTNRSMYDYVKRLKDELGKAGLSPMIEVHCHNDRGLALANAIDGYRAGAEIIDCSVLGMGERCGIVDLATLIAVLFKDFKEEQNWDMTVFSSLYNIVSRYSGLNIPHNAPIVGENAFRHCAGVHTQAAIRNPLHYQSIDPQMFGRSSQISLDQMSGLSSVMYSLEKLGSDFADIDLARDVLQKVKDVGMSGRVVDLTELKCIVDYLKLDEND